MAAVRSMSPATGSSLCSTDPFVLSSAPPRSWRGGGAASGGGGRSPGLETRAGAHPGEVELRGRTAGGIAVHIGARVLAAAQPGEILVTATLRDLVAGAGTEFGDRGAATLKGVPGEWHLYAVVPVAGPEAAEAADSAGGREAERRSPRVRNALLVAIAGASLASLAGIAALLLMRPPAPPVVLEIGRASCR